MNHPPQLPYEVVGRHHHRRRRRQGGPKERDFVCLSVSKPLLFALAESTVANLYRFGHDGEKHVNVFVPSQPPNIPTIR